MSGEKAHSFDPSDLLVIGNIASSAVALANPVLGFLLQSIGSIAQVGINASSQSKLQERMVVLEVAFKRIDLQLRQKESNYEAMVIAPEILKDFLVTDDHERAKDYILLLEGIFSSGKIEFDDFKEAFGVISSLSKNEYRLMKRIPQTKISWAEAFPEMEYLSDRENWIAALKKMEGKYIIRIDVPLYPGCVNTTISFTDAEKVCLSVYGRKILDTLGFSPEESE